MMAVWTKPSLRCSEPPSSEPQCSELPSSEPRASARARPPKSGARVTAPEPAHVRHKGWSSTTSGLALTLALGTAAWGQTPEPPAPTAAQARVAIQRGIDFLLKDQNADGSWGGPRDSITTWSGSIWSNPESHRAWQVATTGLCCAALLEAGSTESAGVAADRAVRYLIDNADVKRPSVWDTMNCWAHLYGLQGLAVAFAHPRYAQSPLRTEIDEASGEYLKRLGKSQSIGGGWGYLEFSQPRTRRPQWSTSFTTAAAVVAMAFAQRSGFDVDQAMLDRAVRTVEHCRLPNGGYSYSVDVFPQLGMERINNVKGSLSRIQVCQAAALLTGGDVPLADRQFGLAHFFKDHKFLEIAMHKPVPHEAYYY